MTEYVMKILSYYERMAPQHLVSVRLGTTDTGPTVCVEMWVNKEFVVLREQYCDTFEGGLGAILDELEKD